MLTLLPLLASSFAPPPRVRVARVAPRRASDLLLIGDVGGTNSRLQLHEMARSEVAECAFDGTGCAAAAASGKLVSERRYENARFASFDAVVAQFFRDEALADAHLAVVCLAVAGVVKNNACQLTNRDALWRIDGAALDAALPKGAAKVVLVNDFLGAGYGLLSLDPRDSVDLASGAADGDGPMACLGAGTGLGEVYLTPNLGAEGLGYTAWPTEGGHVDLAPRDDEEAELLAWLKARVTDGGRVSVERVCSGPGVAHVYAFLAERRAADPGVAAEVAEADAVGQGARVIGAAAAAGRCDVCARAMDIFASLLGNEAGNARRPRGTPETKHRARRRQRGAQVEPDVGPLPRRRRLRRREQPAALPRRRAVHGRLPGPRPRVAVPRRHPRAARHGEGPRPPRREAPRDEHPRERQPQGPVVKTTSHKAQRDARGEGRRHFASL